ncbi:hypothetical protein KGA66_12780 [Actinocrinis puniceicyclus]|uniref:PknH-like extracellular domain-containing protein n=1 Tax=Actinocrinis puniceicyclus TaxID=977794 RepID=A0A8J8BCV9_9ACTN|nr:hypothetical protein [Actinocrinis puniceicyclus]MBS2963925.1 hypothetical protein [Actinocrinis puniceicyclus]
MATRIHRNGIITGAAALVASAALAACSGGGSSSASSSASAAHDVPSGKQLSGILLRAADVPKDYNEESIGAQNSGALLSATPPKVDLGSADCNTVLNLINTVGQNSLGEASYASDAFTPPSGLGEFDETLLEFHGTEATTFTNKLGAALNRCGTFQAADASGATQSASVKVTPGPRLGDESVGFTVKVAIGGQTMVMNGAAVRVGTAVAVIDNSQLQGQHTEIDLAALAGVLVPRIRSLH